MEQKGFSSFPLFFKFLMIFQSQSQEKNKKKSIQRKFHSTQLVQLSFMNNEIFVKFPKPKNSQYVFIFLFG